jgi:hypothetical protein
MSESGTKRGLKSYLGTLVATVLFPVLWMQALRLARRHEDVDPRARAKVVVAIVAGLAIGLAGTYALIGFFASSEEGMYDALNVRLAEAVGETEYKDQVATAGAAEKAIPIIEMNLANATDPAKRAALQTALNDTQKSLDDARRRSAELEANHAAYERINASIPDQDDAQLRALVAQAPAYEDKDERATTAFAIKDRAVADMQLFGILFLWPSLAGAFFAPLAFALGSILRKAFVPSDTVGFKPYPGGAAGAFLLLGAFGLPSVPFAAWTFHDAFGRSEEGQIAL